MAPAFTGIHHLKFPVSDLEASATWFERAMLAERVRRFDHVDEHGQLFGVILNLPGVAVPVELRLAPEAAKATAGFDPVTFGVADEQALDDWIALLDAEGVEHSPKIGGFIGRLIEFRTPDGMAIRIYTDPPNGFENVEMDSANVDLRNPVSEPDIDRATEP